VGPTRLGGPHSKAKEAYLKIKCTLLKTEKKMDTEVCVLKMGNMSVLQNIKW
jgi:hypothetical protein